MDPAPYLWLATEKATGKVDLAYLSEPCAEDSTWGKERREEQPLVKGWEYRRYKIVCVATNTTTPYMATCEGCGQRLPEKPAWYALNVQVFGLRAAFFGTQNEVRIALALAREEFRAHGGLIDCTVPHITRLQPKDVE